MIRSTLGAPFGGTTVGGQYGFESAATSLITPPNLGSGDGSCLPSMVVVALGEPSVPVICWACANAVAAIKAATNIPLEICLMILLPFAWYWGCDSACAGECEKDEWGFVFMIERTAIDSDAAD